MKMLKIQESAWIKGLEKLATEYQLFGPVRDKDVFEFKQLEPNQPPALSFFNTRLSPKSIVYPPSQVMFRYTLDETKADHHLLKPVLPEGKPKIIFALRPCDAASFLLVKRNFDNPDYPDPYWINAFAATTFVGLACDQPLQTCFCSSVDGGPYSENGLDLLLIQAGDGYFAKVLTLKGETLVKIAEWRTETTLSAIDERKETAEQKIVARLEADSLKQLKATDLFKAPFWDEVSFACLNCGTCTYACPTCWCFDIQDEAQGTEGTRLRNWDSCMFPLFTLEGSGHNPRPNKAQRVRQRFMHKLKYYPDKYKSNVQCVGCGRCIQLCPVSIDIRVVCDLMKNEKPAHA